MKKIAIVIVLLILMLPTMQTWLDNSYNLDYYYNDNYSNLKGNYYYNVEELESNIENNFIDFFDILVLVKNVGDVAKPVLNTLVEVGDSVIGVVKGPISSLSELISDGFNRVIDKIKGE